LLHKVTEQEVLTPQETKSLILATSPGLDRTLIMTDVFSGARISELLALQWPDLDLQNGAITIRRSLSTARVQGELNHQKWRWFDPKTAAGTRTVPIPPQLVCALRTWREKCPESRFNLVFCNAAGEPLDRTTIGREVLAPALKRAGIEKKITPHRLRHTYASTLIMLGRDVAQVSKYLGHSDVNVTLTVYTHFIKRKQDTMDDLEQLIAVELS
jgi:integrase